MPELPEVQAIRNQLEKFVVGHEVMDVEVKNKKVAPDDFTPIVGASFKRIRRFGKVLVFDFDNGYSTVSHIKLTGQFIYRGPKLSSKGRSASGRKNPPPLSPKVVGGVPGKHTHVIFKLNKGG